MASWTALVIGAGALYLAQTVSARQAALFLVGTGAGVVLYRAAFGFTASWGEFIETRRGAGIRAQMLMLALTCAVFFPALSSGRLFAQTVHGSVSPLGLSVLAGAFLFGIGMQLGGGCASGTLYSVGGGSARMLVTLLAFIGGSVLGSAHMPWWSKTPALAPASLVTMFGAPGGLAISLAAMGTIVLATVVVERRRHGRLVAADGRALWPLAAGAVGLAAVNILTLALSGRPWGVTSAFALWGAKFLTAVGVRVAEWPYWTAPAQASALRASVLTDITSVMDFGIVIGAFLAAARAGRLAPRWGVSGRSLAAAVIGGTLLGYGARIAYGCNIGAYFSGIASGSLHGWLWLLAGFAGNVVGTRLRPLFGFSRGTVAA